MKKHITIMTCLLSGMPFLLCAQGTGGFFNQQSSKMKLMIQQIAGYQMYLHEIKNGYAIAGKGLNTLHELKGGTFQLHADYYNSLGQVNPVIKNNPKAQAISGLRQQVINLFTNEISWQQKQQLLSKQEIAYIQAVYQSLLTKCNTDVTELTEVLTPGKLQMTDHQRLEKVDQLYTEMQDKKSFAASFTGHCRQLATDRKKSKLDNQQLKKLYGVS